MGKKKTKTYLYMLPAVAAGTLVLGDLAFQHKPKTAPPPPPTQSQPAKSKGTGLVAGLAGAAAVAGVAGGTVHLLQQDVKRRMTEEYEQEMTKIKSNANQALQNAKGRAVVETLVDRAIQKAIFNNQARQAQLNANQALQNAKAISNYEKKRADIAQQKYNILLAHYENGKPPPATGLLGRIFSGSR